MTRATLEERIAALETQVAALIADKAGTVRAKDWRRTRGAFTDDDLMKQVFEEGRKIRDADRERRRSLGMHESEKSINDPTRHRPSICFCR